MARTPAKRFNEEDHKLLALWAADCAEHVFSSFEEMCPNNELPRKVIEAAHAAEHARHVSAYAVKAARNANEEIDWQYQDLPEHLRSIVFPILNINSKKEFSMSPARMSKLEAAMRIVLAFNEAFNRYDVAGMMQLMSEDCVFENTDPAPDGTKYVGKEAVTQFWRDFFRDSPHAHIDIEEIFSLGHRCIMRWKYNWEDAEGKRGHVRGVDIFRVEDGLISEKFSYVKG